MDTTHAPTIPLICLECGAANARDGRRCVACRTPLMGRVAVASEVARRARPKTFWAYFLLGLGLFTGLGLLAAAASDVPPFLLVACLAFFLPMLLASALFAAMWTDSRDAQTERRWIALFLVRFAIMVPVTCAFSCAFVASVIALLFTICKIAVG